MVSLFKKFGLLCTVFIMTIQLQAMEHTDAHIASMQEEELRSLIWQIELHMLAEQHGGRSITAQETCNIEQRVRHIQLMLIQGLQCRDVDNEKVNNFINYCSLINKKCSPYIVMTPLMRLERAYNILYQSLHYACHLTWPDKVAITNLYSHNYN